MPADMFLKLDGIKGESSDHKHKDSIQIDSFSWGVNQEVTLGRGGGGGASKAQFQSVNVVKLVDKSSPDVILFCANGKHIPSGVLTVRKAGEHPLEYLQYKMTNVLISSYSSSGSAAGDLPMESISLNYAKIEIEYHEQGETGADKGTFKMGWDLNANKKV